MTSLASLQLALVLGLLLLTVRPLGLYMQRVFAGQRTVLSPLLRPIETTLYRLAGISPDQEQGWFDYALAFLLFHLPGIALLYLLLRLQHLLPLNQAGLPPVPPDLALNTAVSFATNTSWQSYGGETTLGPLAQMAGIAVQSFLSAAAGIAVAIALIRGLSRHGAGAIGNFWVDLTRATLYVLLPFSLAAGLFLAWQGVPQTLHATTAAATTLQGAHQSIPIGPVASQEAIKLLSGDGGGFFNAQSAHPFENPTTLTNLLGMLLMPLIGAALTNCFGRMVGDQRQGWALLCAMLLLLVAGAVALHATESAANPLLAATGIDQHPGNLEGKELRFGIPGSTLFSELGTATSSGAVNAMHDSYMPLGGLVLLANMMLDEVIIGGPGSGLFGMLLYALVAVFIGGLMIGRTPEYIGNKIEAREIKLTVLAILMIPATLLCLTALAVVLPAGLAALGNAGPHGFSEVLYAYTSAANTNGSAFAGLSANTRFYNLTLALAMVLGRFFVVVPVLALAGSLAGKRLVPASLGTLPTTGPLWVGLLLGVIVIVGGLSYLPALALGPIAEQMSMAHGLSF
ncbi:MAG TPA: potassium-transporting ATPase subunit KdpA [Rhodopila sp.]|nr:potassium-transporting ATPase subunit KdpA [Rhodopila sp.]